MDIKSIELIRLQTKFMRNDPTTRALCQALNLQLQDLASKLSVCLLLPNVDSLPEKVLDQLAEDLHIDWYDATAAIDIKRALIKSSEKVHMYLGTPYAIEQVIQDYFGDGYVEEWFEYGGQPFNFRVVTNNASVTAELANQFTKAVEAVKRKSTRLEQVIIALSASFDMYFGLVLHTGDQYTIEQVV